MTKENEIKLINVIALKQIGNAKFGKKYGIRCNAGNELLKPYAEKETEPPKEVLQEAEKRFVTDFTNQIVELLKKDMPEEFFKDLIFNTLWFIKEYGSVSDPYSFILSAGLRSIYL